MHVSVKALQEVVTDAIKSREVVQTDLLVVVPICVATTGKIRTRETRTYMLATPLTASCN